MNLNFIEEAIVSESLGSIPRPRRQHRLDKGLRGWIVNTAKRNHWRVAAWYDLEDLIQDGYVCYAKCNQRYGHVRDQAHFMALVKTTYIHHITDLANNRTNCLETLVDTSHARRKAVSKNYRLNEYEDANDMLSRLAGGVHPDAEFVAMLHSLPKELKLLLTCLLNDAKYHPYIRGKDGTFETNNEFFCRLIGADPMKVNLESMFRAHFNPV